MGEGIGLVRFHLPFATIIGHDLGGRHDGRARDWRRRRRRRRRWRSHGLT
jgi:hypothetical protein